MGKTISSGSSLTEEHINDFIKNAGEHKPQNITLVAPNKEIAEQWAEQYPGCTILLSSRLASPKQRKESN